MTDAQGDPFAHAFDGRLIDADHTVVRPRQAAERTPQPHRQRPGNDAQPFRSLPAHRFTMLPERLRLAEHPASDRMPCEAPPGKAAARRSAEEHHVAGCDIGMLVERLQDHEAAETMADKMRGADPARETDEIACVRSDRA